MNRAHTLDDDYGDWLHEIKKQKALDKRWDELAALATPPTVADSPLYSYECVCPSCGQTSEHFSPKPMERAEYAVYCSRCTEG